MKCMFVFLTSLVILSSALTKNNETSSADGLIELKETSDLEKLVLNNLIVLEVKFSKFR